MSDLESAGLGVIGADLLFEELMLEHLDLDARVRRNPGYIETERPEIAREHHFHRPNTAGLDCNDKILARCKGHVGRVLKAQARRISEIQKQNLRRLQRLIGVLPLPGPCASLAAKALSMAARRADVSMTRPLARWTTSICAAISSAYGFVGRYEEQFGLFARLLSAFEDRAH